MDPRRSEATTGSMSTTEGRRAVGPEESRSDEWSNMRSEATSIAPFGAETMGVAHRRAVGPPNLAKAKLWPGEEGPSEARVGSLLPWPSSTGPGESRTGRSPVYAKGVPPKASLWAWGEAPMYRGSGSKTPLQRS